MNLSKKILISNVEKKMMSKMIPSIREEKVLLLVLAVCVGSNFKQ